MVRSSVSLVLAVILLVSCVSAQLNFSPGWGKRAAAAVAGSGSEGNQLHTASGLQIPASRDNCDTNSINTVMQIYRLIKREVTRQIQCQDEEYMA